MAFYDRKAYVRQESAYGSPTNHPEPIQSPMTVFRNSERYVMAKTEQVVKFRGGDHGSPTRKELHKDHGAGGEKDHGPRMNNFGTGKNPPPPTYYNTPDYGKYTHGAGGEKDHGPRKNNFGTGKNPPPPTYYNSPDYGKYTHLSSDNDDDDDDISPKNSYAPPPPPGYPVPYHDKGYAPLKLEHRQYDTEKNKTSGNAPLPGYPTPYNDNNNDQKKHGKGDNGSGYVPPKLSNIPQIKTRIGDPEFAKASPPKRGSQGYQEVINSTEARRKYGGPYAEVMYNGTIDCKEAAKKYNGIFVP